MPEWKVVQGDCLEVLKGLPDGSFDSMVTDPPAGIAMMNKDWDCFRRRHNPADVGRDSVHGRMSAHAPHSYGESDRGNFIAFMTEVMQEALRVLKPGAHCLVWALPRTSHWTATALEDAGFEVRDCITHHYGSGFPKSMDVSKAIDKALGAEGTFGEPKSAAHAGWIERGRMRGDSGHEGYQRPWMQDEAAVDKNARQYLPGSIEARAYSGFGTALKPATEHWILCRKPLSESSIARNVLKHGTGGLNIDACRVNRASDDVPGWHKTGAAGSKGYQGEDTFRIRDMSAEEIQVRCGDKGRWPPNLLLTCPCEEPHDDPTCPIAEMDRQSGTLKSGKMKAGTKQGATTWCINSPSPEVKADTYGDSGGASRFFPTFRYQAKPSSSERNAGLDEQPDRTLNRVNPGGIENDPRWAPVQVKNNHPTLKGISLMKWLCQLITPVGGYILDPFLGSGSTGCAAVQLGYGFYGCDKEAEYVAIAESRIRYWEAKAQATEE